MSCGGATDARAADAEIQTLIDGVKDQALAKAKEAGRDGDFATYEAKSVRSQVVAGTNFFVKVQVSDSECIHLRIHQPLPHTGEKASVAGGKVGQDVGAEVEYF
mmetsp:Transcript_2922/g.4557  ORF Transcript_2922/g.4557 Transcript_2922/m.4557 type:complete len:104 (-) Transcript_2922:38-349(-)